MWLYFFSTVTVGMLITLHISMNANAGIYSGDQRAVNVIFWLAGSAAAIVSCLVKGSGNGFIGKISVVPPWLYIAGIIGAGISLYTSSVIPRLGVANMTIILLVGQLAASAAFSHFGLLGSPKDPVSLWKIGGLCLVLLGLALFMYGKKLSA